MCGRNLLLLLLLLLPLFLFAEPDRDFIFTANTPISETSSNPQTPENYSSDTQQSARNLSESNPPLINPNNPWNGLRALIAEGLQGLSESSDALTQLEQQLGTLKAETQEQRRLLEESRSLVSSLRKSLAEAQSSVDIAIDRMQDAEDYALWIDSQNEYFRQQARQYRKFSLIGFSFGGVFFGVGTPLVVEGIRSDNRAMLWSGASVIGIGSLVWAAGYYIFHWW